MTREIAPGISDPPARHRIGSGPVARRRREILRPIRLPRRETPGIISRPDRTMAPREPIAADDRGVADGTGVAAMGGGGVASATDATRREKA